MKLPPPGQRPLQPFRVDLIASVMSRDRFEVREFFRHKLLTTRQDILRTIHFNVGVDPKKPLHRLQALMDIILYNCPRLWNAGEALCADEAMIKFKGRFTSKVRVFAYSQFQLHPNWSSGFHSSETDTGGSQDVQA